MQHQPEIALQDFRHYTFVGTLEPFIGKPKPMCKRWVNRRSVRYREFDRCFHAFDAIAGALQSAD